jgi:hypothetical protein
MHQLINILLLIFLTGCISLSEKVSHPPAKDDVLLRASIVKDLSFLIREEVTEFPDYVWRNIVFTESEKAVLIQKAERVNHDWDGN